MSVTVTSDGKTRTFDTKGAAIIAQLRGMPDWWLDWLKKDGVSLIQREMRGVVVTPKNPNEVPT